MFPSRLFAANAVAVFIAVHTCTAAAPPVVGPRQSSPIAITSDDQFVLNVNSDANTVTLFNVTGNVPRKLREIPVGKEPLNVAIQPDCSKAYVLNGIDGTVSTVDLGSRRQTSVVNVGVEPMGACLSPNGTRLYVANSSSNTLTVLDTSVNPPTTVATIDLSSFGTSPRAVSVSNDGDLDDTDETIFVAMFFGQLRTGKTFLDEGQDDQRQGHVVAISAATNTVLGAPNPIVLGPIANAGFNSNGQLAPGTSLVPAVASTNPQTFTTPTGAFPNQLASIALHPTTGKAYVVSTGASPNGPLRFNQMAQGLVSVFDAATRTEVTAAQTDPTVRRRAPLNLNQGINLATTPAPRLFMTNPVAMAWRPNGSDAWVVVQNSDLVTRLTVDAGDIPSVNAPLVAGPSTIVRVDLQGVPPGHLPGKAPRGLAINNAGSKAYVANFVSRNISVIDISNATAPTIVGTAQSTAPPAKNSVAEFVQQGAELFHTGRGPNERMSSESWGGCIVCHPNGRSDNITWMFDAGPRQTVNLDGMFDPKSQPANTRRLNWTRGKQQGQQSFLLGEHPQRLLNWSAVRDENQDFELNTRGVFGGRGLIDDDRLFFTVGGESGSDIPFIEQFQQVTGLFTNTNDLMGGAELPVLKSSQARRDFGIATLNDGRVYLIGGRNGSGQGKLIGKGDAILEFNPRTNVLTKRNGVGFTPRHSLGAAAVKTSGGQRIYVIGGYNSTSDTASPVNTVEEYNPATNTWRTVASIPTGVAQFGTTVTGGTNTAEPMQLIHTFSGNQGSESSPSLLDGTTPAYTVQRFQADPNGTGTWSTFNPTGLTPRRNHGIATAFRGAGSRVFIIGGQNAAGTVLDTVEEYQGQALTPVLTPHTSLPAPRAKFGIASSLSTNQIYVIGGQDGTGTKQSTIFEYTINTNGPVTGPTGTPSGTWVTRGNLIEGTSGLQVSSPPGVTNFLPNKTTGRDARQDSIAAWIATNVRTSRAPVPPTDPDATAGRTLFGTSGLVVAGFSCATCHGGVKWTRSAVDFFTPPSPEIGLGLGNERVIGAELRQTATQNPAFPALGQFPGVLINVGTFLANAPAGRVNEIRFNGADISQAIAPLGANGFNIPSLLSVHETAPYYYSGLAQTLEEVLNGAHDANIAAPFHFTPNASDRADLIAFLRSIDATTPIFP